MTWKPLQLLTEALRNLGPSQLSLGILVTLILSATGALTLSQAQSAVNQTRNFNDQGGLVWVASGNAENPLDGAKCDNLNFSEGVAAAGGIAVDDLLGVKVLAETPYLPVKGVTRGTLRVWDRNAPSSGVVVGRNLGELGAAAVGTELLDGSGGTATVEDRTPELVRPEQLSSSLLIFTTADRELTDCWVRMTPGAAALGGGLLTFTFGDSRGVQIVPYISPSTSTASPSEQWHAFADFQPWLIASLLIAVVFGFGAWSKRSEFAIYRAFGTPSSVVSSLALLETLLVALPALAASLIFVVVGGGYVVGGPLGTDLVAVVCRAVASAALLGFALAVPLEALVLRGSVASQLKDR